jgi:hypothetical protein
MNLRRVEGAPFILFRGKQKTIAAILPLLLAAGFLAAGCGEKTAETSPTATGPTASKGTEGGAMKPTAEQEAARQRAIDQGPAIQAANEAAQRGN